MTNFLKGIKVNSRSDFSEIYKAVYSFLVLIVLILTIISCSSDSPEPEMVNQPDDEVVVEEEQEEEQEEMEEEQENTIPFNVSVVLKEIENFQSIGEDFYLQDFQLGRTEPGLLENISEQYALAAEAFLNEAGRPDILFFATSNAVSGTEYVGLDINTRTIRSIQRAVLFDEVVDDCNFPFSIMWDANAIFSVYSDVCGDVEILRPFVKASVDSPPVIFDEIENAFVGDSFHRFWTTENYFIVHYDYNRNEFTIQQDGLVVYDVNSLERVFSMTYDEPISFFVDNSLLAGQTRSGTLQMIDLNTGEVLFDESITERVVSLPKYGTSGNTSIDNMGMTPNKIGVIDKSSAIFVPMFYDMAEMEKITVNRAEYFAFFNRDTIDFSADIIEPQGIKFDLESESFVASYIAVDPNNSGVLKYAGIMYMHFDGTLLYDYRFPEGFFVDQLVKR